jgi:hypothetical protein
MRIRPLVFIPIGGAALLIGFQTLGHTNALPACSGEAGWYGSGPIEETKSAIEQNPFFLFARRTWGNPKSCIYGNRLWEVYFRKGERFLYETSDDVDFHAYTLLPVTPLTREAATALIDQQARHQSRDDKAACQWSSAEVINESTGTVKTANCQEGTQLRAQITEVQGFVTQLRVSLAY